jgi:hypothetical protein
VDSEDGISLFLVPPARAGVHAAAWAASTVAAWPKSRCDNVHVGADALLGTEGQGFATLELAVGWGVLALCAEALGAMDVAKKDTLEYLQTRKQFGVPIGSFQALQHRMADLLLEVEQARSAVINAAAAMDSADRVERERALSAAKFTMGRIGALVAEESIQMHGGIGMTWELPLSHYAKRLVMIDHQLGDEDHHLARLHRAGLKWLPPESLCAWQGEQPAAGLPLLAVPGSRPARHRTGEREVLLTRREGAVLVLSNNNPAARNALSPEFYAALTQALAQAEADPTVGAIVLTGEGGHFCAGGDLRQLAKRRELPVEERRAKLEGLHDLIRAVRDCRKPVIAAVEGAAAGAGLSLALACDMLVAARKTRCSRWPM